MEKPYSYNCEDRSILLPIFKKYYVNLYFRLVPRILTANWITLLSSSMVFFILYVCYQPEVAQTAGFAAVIAFCMHGYLVGDHLDGMQAKHTGTSSPLGEFLDHYLDVYNGAIIFLASVIFFGDIPSWIYYLFLWLNFLAFATTMVEEVETGKLSFGPFGTLEGVMIIIFFFLSWLIPDVRAFWQADFYAGYPAYWIIVIMTGLGYAGTVADIIYRVGYSPRQLNAFALCSGLLGLILYQQDVDYFAGWWLLALYSGEYIARVMGSYLCHRKHEFPDVIASIAIVILALSSVTGFLAKADATAAVLGLTLYLGLKLGRSCWKVLGDLKEHWLWINPALEKDSPSQSSKSA